MLRYADFRFVFMISLSAAAPPRRFRQRRRYAALIRPCQYAALPYAERAAARR
jgi:hypothetical protein